MAVRRLCMAFLLLLAPVLGCVEGYVETGAASPIADAGWDQVRYMGVMESVVVDLDARASCDPLGAPLGPGVWTVVQAPMGSAPIISNLGNLQALFEAKTFGSYQIALTVSTEDRESDADFILIEVREGEGEDIFVDPATEDACGNRIPR